MSKSEQTPLREAMKRILDDYLDYDYEDEMLDDLLALHHQRIQSLIDRLPEEREEKLHAGYEFSVTGKEYNQCLTEVRHLLEGE